MKVTVTQLGDDREEFADQWRKLARHVKGSSSDVVLLPEMPFSSWFCAAPKFDPKVWRRVVEEHRRWMERLGELGAPVVLGTSPLNQGRKRHNVGFVWTPKGVEWVQRKNYPPNERGFYEATWYQRGDRRFKEFEVGRLKGGFMICSDIWSMSNARALGKGGAHLIATPRATGKGSLEKWLAGGRVASVVSGAYSFSSNRSGMAGEVLFGGMGWAIDPDGMVIGTTSESSPFLTVDVDPKKAEAAKKTYPRDSLEPD